MVASRSLAAILAASGLSRADPGTTNHGLQPPVMDGFGPSIEVARSRGPQIFNAVHDAMRQWGASLHHNGMSFFLATVPEGVILHHGSNDQNSPDEPEWLAYEIEHAEGFARGRMGPGPPGKGPGGGPPPAMAAEDLAQIPLGYEETMQELRRRETAQEPPVEDKGGWLHTYRTTRPLRYLYIDGMGAGKTTMGTLDSQDYLLRGTRTVFGLDHGKDDSPERRGPGRGGPMDERARAVELCALSKEWGTSGVIRMEAGFEIIQCDFADGLEELQAMQRPGDNGRGRGGNFGSFEFVRGLAERYQDIGSARTTIDYSSMVSAFFFPVNLTNPDPARPDLPRLSNTTDAELAAIQGYLNKTISNRFNHPARPIDWQDVTDIIVGRYADRIKYMAEKTTTVGQIADEIRFLLTVFIDYSSKDAEQVPAAIERCTNFYLHAIDPVTESDEMIYAAIRSATSELCTRLFDVRELVSGESGLDDAETRAQAVAILQGLMKHLSWARFKRCPSCDVNEVCFIPMWPLGSKADYYSPRCVNSSTLNSGDSESYWGHFGPGAPGGGKGGRDGRGPPP